MNKIFSYCATLLFSVLAVSLTSCTEEYEYTGASVEGEQVYFSSALSSTVELSVSESSFVIPVNRVNTSGGLTVDLNVTVPEGSNYTIPTSVTFADGSNVANLTISYDPSALDYGVYDDIELSIAEGAYTTPYGSSTYSFSAGMSEWKTMDGKASYRDGIMGDSYGLDALTYDVEIQESVVTPGRYRLVNPYAEDTLFGQEYGDIFTFVDADHYIVIDATDPNYVYTEGTFTPGAYYPEDGELVFYSYVSYLEEAGNYTLDYIKQAATQQGMDIFATLTDGVIRIPEDAMVLYIDGSYYYSNTEGLMAIALPGYKITDYSSSFTYTGRFTDTKNVDYAQGIITLGEDVASAKYYVAADGDDIDAIIDAIIEGDIEAETVTESGTTVTVQLSETGVYYMVIVTYDESGNVAGNSSTKFTFKSSAGGSSEPTWTAVLIGEFYYNYIPNFVIDSSTGDYVGGIQEGVDEDVILYQDISNPTSFKVYPWNNSPDGLEFTIDDDDYLHFMDANTGYTYGSYGLIYGADFCDLLPSYGTGSSFYQYEEGLEEFWFGTIYYVSAGYVGGAYEVFVADETSTASPEKVKQIEEMARVPQSLRRTVEPTTKVNLNPFVKSMTTGAKTRSKISKTISLNKKKVVKAPRF